VQDLRQYWDNQEIDLLKINYPSSTKEMLIDLFPKRTYDAIQRMASYLGIKRILKDFHPPAHRSEETKMKISRSLTGMIRSKETRTKMRLVQLGNQNWLNRNHLKASRDKMSQNFTGEGNPMYGRTCEKHPQWKGDKASYSAIHLHLRKYNPQPKSCMDCDIVTTKLDLACVTGIYDRNLKNYRYLCRSCHSKIDNYKHFKDMSDRVCSECGSNETYIRRDGTMNWNHVDGGLLCGRCYTKYRRKGKKTI
jgi:hypothetical protein